MGRIKKKNGKPNTKITPKITAFCVARSATHSVGAMIDELCKSEQFPEITRRNPPAESTLYHQLFKFKTKFTVRDLRKNEKCCEKRPISSTGDQNTARVKQIHDEIFKKYRFKKHASVRYIEQRTRISNRSIRIINKARLHLRFYKRTTAPKSTPHSVERRLEFSKWGKELFQVENGDEIEKMLLLRDHAIFVDETSVQKTPYFNRKNLGIWREEMPTGNDNIHHKVVKAESVMAFVCVSKLLPDNHIYVHWCPPGQITAESYHAFLRDEIFPILKSKIGRENWKKVWWMEDGAPGHHSFLVSDFLDDEFDGKVVACDFLKWHPWTPGADWPPYSCDITPLDFFVNPAVKELTWLLEEETGLIKNLDDLRRNFEMACSRLDGAQVRRAIDAVPEQVKICEAAGGGAFEKYKDKIKIKLRKK